jgi:hypothetical protein
MAMQWTFKFEPALWLGLVRAGLALGMAFGLNLSAEQMSVVILFSESLFALLQRSVVTPNATLHPATVDAARAGDKP